MDISETCAPRSDQLNAEDLIAGPVTVTIAGVRPGAAEQPVDIDLIEYPGRAYRPAKTMRRLLVAAWGADSSTYAGRRLTLYRDPSVKFGGDQVGGIRISHLSHIDKPIRVALTVTRGKRAPFVVEPLPAERDWSAEIAAATSDEQLMAIWEQSGKRADVSALIKARHDELAATQPEQDVIA